MKSNASTAELGDLVDEILDRRGVTPLKLGGAFTPMGHRVISAKLVKDGRLDLGADEPRFVSPSIYKKWMQTPLHCDDVILTSEAPLGEVAYISETLEWCLGQRLFGIRTKKNLIHGRFLYYALQSDPTRSDLLSRATGTTVLGIRQSELRRVRISTPPLAEQKRIAGILGALDDKIELNRRMNKTLEDMARALFQSWFVDFDPVRRNADRARNQPSPDLDGPPSLTGKRDGDEGLAAHDKLFPDSFQDSPLGPIPKGWTVKTADEISTVGIGKTPPRKEHHWFSENPSDVPWISIRDLGEAGVFISRTSEYLTAEAVEKFHVRRIPDNTVVLSFKLTMGRVAITDGEMLSNEAIAHFRLNSDSPIGSPYLYCYLKGFEYNQLGSTSSIATAINSDMVRGIKILIPPKEVGAAFEKSVAPLFAQIKCLQNQSRTLAALRDTLLPKLLSGATSIDQAHQ